MLGVDLGNDEWPLVPFRMTPAFRDGLDCIDAAFGLRIVLPEIVGEGRLFAQLIGEAPLHADSLCDEVAYDGRALVTTG